jgi:hypothetical protein
MYARSKIRAFNSMDPSEVVANTPCQLSQHGMNEFSNISANSKPQSTILESLIL